MVPETGATLNSAVGRLYIHISADLMKASHRAKIISYNGEWGV
jgi:hypothetical protein